MRLTIKDDVKTICVGCRYGQIMRSNETTEVAIWCHELDRRLHFRVSECSKFHRQGANDRWEMEKMAWIIKTDPTSGKKLGFVRPGTAEHKKMIDD